jgi:23S rRNA pseudouridine1911/1915/1917 synthase
VIAVAADAGRRLDRWLADRLPGLSRARLQTLISGGCVQVNGRRRKASHRLRAGDHVEVDIPPLPSQTLEPEAIPLDIVHEDKSILVIDKPAGMVVHPGAGNATGTLAAAVLSYAPETGGVGGAGRPGIVHRLDKGTSGLLVLAKTRAAYDALTAQLVSRTVSRRYLAVVHGDVHPREGVIDAPIGRHPQDRIRMAVRPAGKGKPAVTRYRVIQRFPESRMTYLEATLETGRTHQIRVHLAAQGHPVVGDSTYRSRSIPRSPFAIEGLALHAAELSFTHPDTQARVSFTAPLPARMERILALLRH